MKKSLVVLGITLLIAVGFSAFADVRVGTTVKCKSKNFKVMFRITKSKKHPTWCKSGSGVFTIENIVRKGEVKKVSGKWNNCSKSGLVARGESTEFAIGYRANGGVNAGGIRDKKSDLSEPLECK